MAHPPARSAYEPTMNRRIALIALALAAVAIWSYVIWQVVRFSK